MGPEGIEPSLRRSLLSRQEAIIGPGGRGWTRTTVPVNNPGALAAELRALWFYFSKGSSDNSFLSTERRAGAMPMAIIWPFHGSSTS